MLLFYPVKSLTAAMAATSAAIMLAQVLSAPLAATLMSLHGAAGLRGWQWIAIVEGAATVAVGALLYATLPRSPADVKALSADEVAWVESRVSKHVPRGSSSAPCSGIIHTVNFTGVQRCLRSGVAGVAQTDACMLHMRAREPSGPVSRAS